VSSSVKLHASLENKPDRDREREQVRVRRVVVVVVVVVVPEVKSHPFVDDLLAVFVFRVCDHYLRTR